MCQKACKPDFVEDNHSSTSIVACQLWRPTSGQNRNNSLKDMILTPSLGLASGGVYLALNFYKLGGELLPRRFILTYP